MKGNYYTARFKFQKITVKVATQELRQQTKWLKRTAPLFGSQLDFQKRSSIPSSPSLACCCGGFDAATGVPPDPSPRAASLQLRRSLARDPRTGGLQVRGTSPHPPVVGCSALSLPQKAVSSKGKVDLCLLHTCDTLSLARGCSRSHRRG